MSAVCRSVYFTEPGRVEVRSEHLEAGEGTFLFESELIGISHGTEMLVFRNEFPRDIPVDVSFSSLGSQFSYPVKYGYSNVGTCNSRRAFAFAPHQDRFFTRESELIDIPDGISPKDAIFIPNLETALAAVHDARPRVGELLVVIGGGVVGQLICDVLSRSHYGGFALIEPHESRRRIAALRGITVFSTPNTEFHAWIRDNSEGKGADAVIHASGCEAGLQLGIDILGFAGTLVEASWYGAKRVSLGLGSAFHRKRIKLNSCQVSTIPPEMGGMWDKSRQMRIVLDLLESIRPGYLISHSFPITEAQAAFELIDSHPEEVMQVVLDPAGCE